MIRKTKINKGFTFVEMLLSVALLGLLSLVVAAGSATALNVYREGVGYAESRVLSATLLIAMENDLRYAQDLRMEEEKVKFTSPYYGNEATYLIKDEKIYVQSKVGDADSEVLLLGEKMYTNGQGVASLELNEVEDVTLPYGKLFSVKIEMKDGSVVETRILNVNAK